MYRPDVAIVTPGSFVIPSGKSSSVELVVEQVASRIKSHIRLVVLGRLGRLPASEVRQGVRYIRVPAPSPQQYIRSVSRKLASLRPQVIQVENRPRFVRYLRRRFPQARIWLSLHSVTFVSMPHIGPKELQRCLAAADRIVVNSWFLKEQIERKDPGSVNKIVVNHLGVDPERFMTRWSPEGAAKREMMLHRHGWQDRKIILYVGRLIPMKGVHRLFKVMPQIIQQVPSALLLVVGSAYYGSRRITPYVRKLRRNAAKLNPHVHFIPYVSHGEVDEWFRLADVLVVPSTNKEAFGLVNVEAMASGVPVIATRAGGMKEIVEDGITGRTLQLSSLGTELAPAVTWLLQDEEEVRRMGEKSVDRVLNHFTWEQTAARFLDLYQMEGIRLSEGDLQPF
ncbi:MULTISPECIES: glycosyltransferase family 4 protein [unclassified Paenibacillus]|uniref:glycosyltransferase family 4 protein n=1 Tax=unclassified Paenibacillus TaxID=185978 RepID=UPI001AE5B157|nr:MULTISPECIES: glycosyltransferase family 4 protein [unclassified Paenibacillus]MBP1156669.1 spore coat protein SA [Paenibacillus sp. PvP091]MBP1172593.1 spore coat protein SA [Paenibacillus sp. PvR098]MBP2438973.1 spore coat protein SA [Paenibacillus sp. PvP052]